MYIWIRASFPRYRYDQIMRLGWKIFIPITLLWVVVISVWMQTPFNIFAAGAHAPTPVPVGSATAPVPLLRPVYPSTEPAPPPAPSAKS
jgi:hypothetical protein